MNYTNTTHLKQLLLDLRFIASQLGYYESKVFNLVTDYYTTEELKADAVEVLELAKIDELVSVIRYLIHNNHDAIEGREVERDFDNIDEELKNENLEELMK